MTITNKGGYRMSGGKFILLQNVDWTTNGLLFGISITLGDWLRFFCPDNIVVNLTGL